MKRLVFSLAAATLTAFALLPTVLAEGWQGFRGPGGSGLSSATNLPIQWDNEENLGWRVELPGAGTSSPIVVGNRVYVTCYSGYGVDPLLDGTITDLKRHLVCLSASSGEILWNRIVPALQPEDPYTGQLGEHGYATQTPASDGKHVFAFFGKSGVHAFDLDGNPLWQTSVGTESGRQRWGSAASPILYKDSVIVNAADESQSIRALNKRTGKQIWMAQASSLASVFNTPALATLPDGHQELVLSVPYEVWGLDPDTGKLSWFAETGISGNMNVSIQVQGDVIYAFGGNLGTGTVAIRAGGDGDVTDTHILWSSRRGPDFASPVTYGDHLYWTTGRGVVTCLSAEDGELVFEERLQVEDGFPRVYASPIIAGDHLYQVTRNLGTFILKASPTFRQIAHNTFNGDPTDFNATPAVAEGRLFIRSNLYLYCIQGS